MAGLLVAGLVAAVFLGTGLLNAGSTALSQEEAEQRASLALRSLGQEFAGEGDELRLVKGSMEVRDGGDMFGEADVSMEMEHGTGDSNRMKFTMDSGGMQMQMEAFCTPEGIFMVWGSDVIQSRPEPCDGMMGGMDGMEGIDMTDGMFLEQLAEDEEVEILEVTPHADGTVTAVVLADNATMTLSLDKQGRVVRMDIEDEEASGTFHLEYGARKQISPPAATKKAPANLVGSGSVDPERDVYVHRIWSSIDAPLDELEVHVLDGEETLAVFPMSEATASQDGFHFTLEYTGASMEDFDLEDFEEPSSDQFEIEADGGWDPEWEVRIYDTWAERYTDDEVMTPGPGLLLSALAIGTVVLLRRRR